MVRSTGPESPIEFHAGSIFVDGEEYIELVVTYGDQYQNPTEYEFLMHIEFGLGMK